MSISTIKLSQINIFNKLQTKQQVGLFGEDLARKYLIQKGFIFLNKNVHYREGEIDLIFENEEYLIFIEVKTRTNDQFGKAIDQITGTKVKKVRKCIEKYLLQFQTTKDIRLDTVSIDITKEYIYINHLENITFD